MIKRFLLLLLLILLGWLLASSVESNGPGYVWISYGQLALETTFWGLVIALLLSICTVYIVFRLTQLLLSTLRKFGMISKNWGVKKSARLLQQSRLAFIDENWAMAHQKFSQSLKNTQPLFSDFLMASKSAIKQGDLTAAKELLSAAAAHETSNEFSLLLTELEFHMAEPNQVQVDILLRQMMKDFPSQAIVKYKALSWYIECQQWPKAEKIYSQLSKRDQQAFSQAAESINLYRVEQAESIDQLKAIHKKLATAPAALQQAILAKAYAIEPAYGLKSLRSLLKAEQYHVVAIFAAIALTEPAALGLLSELEKVDNHSFDAAALAALASVYQQANMHNKAIDIYYRSLQLKPCVEVYMQYSELMLKYKSAEELSQQLAKLRH